jgi:hypothetical protein
MMDRWELYEKYSYGYLLTKTEVNLNIAVISSTFCIPLDAAV